MNLKKSSTLKGLKLKRPEHLVRLFSEKKQRSSKDNEDSCLSYAHSPPSLSPSSLSLNSTVTGNTELPESSSKKGKTLLMLKRTFSRKSNTSLILPTLPQSSSKPVAPLKDNKEARNSSGIFNSAGSELNIEDLNQKIDDLDKSRVLVRLLFPRHPQACH